MCQSILSTAERFCSILYECGAQVWTCVFGYSSSVSKKQHSPYQNILQRELFVSLFLGTKCNRQPHVGLQAHRMLKPLISFVFLSKHSPIFKKINLKFRLYRTVTFSQVPIFHSKFSC